jgi:SPP1 gp7 family putative phage head morphogenesis protein
MPYQEEARKILFQFLDRMQRLESKEFLLLSNQWGSIAKELEQQIEKIATKEFKTEDQLYRLELYKSFLADSKTQIKNYSEIANGVISQNQMTFGKMGIESAQQMIGLKVSFFQKLPIEVINNFIGKSFYDGAKLNDTLFLRSYSDYTKAVKDRLLTSIALGKNPRATARMITAECNAPLWQSLRLARTEQLSIWRETSLMQFERSGVVKEWEWLAEPDACDICLEKNGKRFPLTQGMDTHPNCRCAELPII